MVSSIIKGDKPPRIWVNMILETAMEIAAKGMHTIRSMSLTKH